METSNKSTGETLFDLTCYVEDTHANRLANQDDDKANTTQDTCGRGLEKPLAHYDPITRCWKMYEATLISDFQPLSGSWPISGMTRNGHLYQLPRWVPRTLGKGLSFWPTLSASGMGNTGSQQMLECLVNAGRLTEDEKRGMTSGNGGRMNPMWAEWLMGFPAGWTELEG